MQQTLQPSEKQPAKSLTGRRPNLPEAWSVQVSFAKRPQIKLNADPRPAYRRNPHISVHACSQFPRSGNWVSQANSNFQPTRCLSATSRQRFVGALPETRHDSSGGRPEDVKDIVIGREDHQHENQREADSEAHLLSPFRQRTAAHSLDCVEHKVTTIQERHRE